MKYIKTSIFTYNEFINEYKTNRLSKNLKIYGSTYPPKYLDLNEIFDSNLKLVEGEDFIVQKIKHPEYENEYNFIYVFKTKDKTEYRLDFIVLEEDNKNLKNEILHNKKFISVAFALYNATSDNYDEVTLKNNQFEVLNCVIYLVNHFKNTIDDSYIFMFGDPILKEKIDVYNYIIYKCFPEYKILKDFTSGFDKTNLGFYLIKIDKNN